MHNDMKKVLYWKQDKKQEILRDKVSFQLRYATLLQNNFDVFKNLMITIIWHYYSILLCRPQVEITTFLLHPTLFYKNWTQENILYKKYNYRGHIISLHCSLFFFIKRLITQFLLLTMEIGLKARVEKVSSSQTVS